VSEKSLKNKKWEEEEGEFRWETIDQYSEYDWNNKSMRGAADDARSIDLRLREGFGVIVGTSSSIHGDVTVSLGSSALNIISGKYSGDEEKWWEGMEMQPISLKPTGGTYRDCEGQELVLRPSEEDRTKWGDFCITLDRFTLERLSRYFVDWYDRR